MTSSAPTNTAPNINNSLPQQQQRRMAPIGDSSLSMEEEWEQRKRSIPCAPQLQNKNGSIKVSQDPAAEVDNGDNNDDDANDKSLFRGSRYDYHRDDSAVRDVVCASTALMGENILDSPVSRQQQQQSRMFQLRDRSSLGTPTAAHSSAAVTGDHLPALPSLYNNDNNDSTSRRSDHGRAMAVGIMAQGLAWARRQRDRRKQQYLQWQAEQQLRKIEMAQEEMGGGGDDHVVSSAEPARTLLDNSIFQNLASRSSSSGEVGDFVVVDHHHHSHPDKRKASAFAISKKISKSGDGYSVELPGVVLDDDPQHNNNIKDEDDASWVPPVRVDEEPPDTLASCPYILNANERQQIAVHVLPAGISSYCKWKRYYSLARDGDSFDNCLRNLQHIKPTLLVVRTTRNAVFGGFADEAWEPHSAGGACFYGGSAACLFKIVPSHASDKDDGDDDDNASNSTATTQVKYFRWSGANRYVQLCDVSNKMLAFGGGGKDGAFGLCVEQDFQVGSTGPCATFNNEPLCDQENFDICDMEIYGFLQGQF